MSIFDILSDHEMNVVVGCGRLGSNIATMLSASGKNVVVIDANADAFRKLGPEYSGFTVEANGTDIDALKKAGIEKAVRVMSVTNDDNVNIMVAQIAKAMFNIPLVIARLYDPEKEIIMNEYDIKTIYPNKLSMSAFKQLLSG